MKIYRKSYRISLCIGISLLIAIAVCFNYGAYLPVAGNMIAEKKLTQYSNRLIPYHQKVKTVYDWYNSRYVTNDREGNMLAYRLKSNTIYDEAVSIQINLGARAQFEKAKQVLSPDLEFASDIHIWTEINADDYSVKRQRLYLLGIYSSQYVSEEESRKMPAAIARQVIELMGDDYNFTGIQLIYYDRNGGYTIEIPSGTFEPLKYEDMLGKHKEDGERGSWGNVFSLVGTE